MYIIGSEILLPLRRPVRPERMRHETQRIDSCWPTFVDASFEPTGAQMKLKICSEIQVIPM